ncbi:MAG: imidazole glycerol phosphate synthase subunit HisH [Rhodothermales bacterium]|nr:imidazole glycerol phosphate synthase subunit HisH [Rhodothermales bacterium]MBO6778291.1 imidazole glycerol phosphate synthase subunit HisH [Rhodothermales bacterium]
MSQVAVVRYNAGNISSVSHALRRLGVAFEVTNDHDALRAADRVIFPGVGEASSAMAYLRERELHTLIPSLTQPVLGICLGLQLMCDASDENEATCLGIFPGRVRLFPPRDKVPHIGWNSIHDLRGPLFKGIPDGAHVYFVHGYYAELGAQTTARTDYVLPFSAGLSGGNFHSVQFHPEKSGDVGAAILQNFLSI